ncbi:hypothetical protein TNCV_1625351 [Trichonephila clavipes]|nr:hypothetical protein TNCV_1625351 [Trichonephila clavipes]
MPRTRQLDPLLTQTASEKFNLIDLIPMYDGGESLGIRRFLEKINVVVNLGKWSNAEKVTILKLKLAGIAEEFFLSDPTHCHLTEYNDIARVLINRFEKAVPLSTRLQLFSSCIQGSSESVQEFAARINKLGTQIFHSSDTAQNTVEASSVTVRKTGGDPFSRRETVFKCFYCGFQRHRQAECRKKRMDERRANYQPPERRRGRIFCFPSPKHSFFRSATCPFPRIGFSR